jgi:hypothetical protein
MTYEEKLAADQVVQNDTVSHGFEPDAAGSFNILGQFNVSGGFGGHSGTVASVADAPINVTFDATAVPQPGTYDAQLKVDNGTPYDLANIPVTMTVLAPDTLGELNGIVTGLGHCDADPAVLEGAQVHVESSEMETVTVVISTPVLTEDFETWPPTGWAIINNGGCGVWTTNLY